MVWINKILQGKDNSTQDETFKIDQVQVRHPRKNSVQFTTDVIPAGVYQQMFVNEDKDLNVCINQYKLLKEVSVGINSRVGIVIFESFDLYRLI